MNLACIAHIPVSPRRGNSPGVYSSPFPKITVFTLIRFLSKSVWELPCPRKVIIDLFAIGLISGSIFTRGPAEFLDKGQFVWGRTKRQ